jgi:hypothetical protein
MSVRDHEGSQSDGSRGNRVERYGSTIPVSSSQQVHVEIDELVLTGFSRSESQKIAESLKETLGQLFAGDVARWSESDPIQVDSLDAGKVQVRRSGRAQSTGERVARAIYGSLPR